MRILQVAYKSSIDGGEVVLMNLAKSLHAKGHFVLAAVPGPGPLVDELAELGIESVEVPMRKTYDFKSSRRLTAVLREHKIDLAHSHGMLVNILTRRATHKAHTPISISTEHITLDLAGGGRAKNWRDRLRNVYYRYVMNRTARYNDAIIGVSHAVRDDLIAQGISPDKVVAVQNGIEIGKFDAKIDKKAKRLELGLKPDEFIAGMVGRFSVQKDIPTFLRAMKKFTTECPNARGVILGDGYLRTEMEALRRELGLDDKVVFLGYRRDVHEVLATFDVFVLSSLWEGLPLVVLEAMASRMPVVATAVPGTVEAVVDGETGFIAPLGDSETLGSAVAKLYSDRDLLTRFAEKGRKRVEEKFSLARNVEETEALYYRIARQKGIMK